MNIATIVSLVIAVTSVLGTIGSVLLLAYRVGRLTGATDARITHGEKDRASLWHQVTGLAARFDRHIEHHPGAGR